VVFGGDVGGVKGGGVARRGTEMGRDKRRVKIYKREAVTRVREGVRERVRREWVREWMRSN